MIQNRIVNIKGKRFKQIDCDLIAAQAGHRLYLRLVLLLVGCSMITFCSILPSFSGQILISLLAKFTFGHKLESFISFVEILAYAATIVLTVAFGSNLRFISYFIAFIAGIIIVGYFVPQDDLTGDIIVFALCLVSAWSGTVSIATLKTVLTTLFGFLGNFIGAVSAVLSILFYIKQSLSDNNFWLEVLASIVVILASLMMAHLALRNAPKLVWMHDIAVFFAAIGGTSFYSVNLTDIHFDGSDLRHSDLRRANLTRTSFKNVKNLGLARLKGTILEDPRVRELLVSRNGIGQDFTDADLRGANLQEAKLQEAILVRSQLLDADLSDADLTNACIQDWNINRNTRFAGVKCKRVYLKRSPSGHFLEPKPDSGEFLPGEFEKWVTDIRDTIDLIFQNGLNWRAFAFSLTQTAIDHEGLDLSVRSIENKGDGVVVAKVGVSLETNKTAIHQQLTDTYQGAVGAIEAGYQLALRAKDDEIERLTDFYEVQQKFIQGLVTSISETKAPVVIQGERNRVYLMDQAGDIMENSNQNVSAGGNVDMSSGARVSIGGDMTGSTVNLGELSGQVSNRIQQLHDIQTGEGEELAKILATLQDAIESDRALTPNQKQEALEAVATLAEEGSKPPEQRTSKFSKMAVNALKGLASTVTDVSKLAEVMKTLLPTLTKILML